MKMSDQIQQIVDLKKTQFSQRSDNIWEYAETRFELNNSAQEFIEILKHENFNIEHNLAGMEHAFIGTFGHGYPIVGVLAEYDALSNMGHKENSLDPREKTPGNGHACGHNLLGMGALAGAVAIKDYMEKYDIKGTIKIFGCPAEESGYGKAFLAKSNYFDDLDFALTWHPNHTTQVWGEKTLAVNQVYFKFKGISSHASASPHLGRSALDAAELMNVGVNYLREHLEDDVRIHYAYLDAGGVSPNVVQDSSTLYYFIRSKSSNKLKKIYNRVLKVAQGAALMTETELEVIWDSSCLDFVPNENLSRVMYDSAKELDDINLYDTLDYRSTLSSEEEENILDKLNSYLSDEEMAFMKKQSFNPFIAPFEVGQQGYASTDVGDVSWICPTAQMFVACEPLGTAMHSWQWVSKGKSKMAHQGISQAAKIIALSAIKVMTSEYLLESIKEEHKKNLNGKKYESAIPEGVTPKQKV